MDPLDLPTPATCVITVAFFYAAYQLVGNDQSQANSSGTSKLGGDPVRLPPQVDAQDDRRRSK